MSKHLGTVITSCARILCGLRTLTSSWYTSSLSAASLPEYGVVSSLASALVRIPDKRTRQTKNYSMPLSLVRLRKLRDINRLEDEEPANRANQA